MQVPISSVIKFYSLWILLQVRVKAVPNGETKERAVVVFGATMEEVCNQRFYIFF